MYNEHDIICIIYLTVAVSQCAVCEEAMSHLDDALLDPEVKNNNIKAAVDKVCYHVDKSEFDDVSTFFSPLVWIQVQTRML